MSKPSPEFLTFATAQVEILPSHKERGCKSVQNNDKKMLTALKGYSPLYGLKTSPTRRAEVQDDKDCRSEEFLVPNPSPLEEEGVRRTGEGEKKGARRTGHNATNIGGLTTAFAKDFTLAEILITLGIIGIVAAMTLPTLIDNYQKRKTSVN